jgi:hypothetical protein
VSGSVWTTTICRAVKPEVGAKKLVLEKVIKSTFHGKAGFLLHTYSDKARLFEVTIPRFVVSCDLKMAKIRICQALIIEGVE